MQARHIVTLALALAVLAPYAHADRSRIAPREDLPAWRSECGTCHVAYPPALLTARDWRTVMSSLDRHYGTDATLDAATAASIAGFLERNAGAPRGAVTAGPPRITTSDWFARKHREIATATWSRKSIGTAANCGACHPGADAGNFDEHAVRVPR